MEWELALSNKMEQQWQERLCSVDRRTRHEATGFKTHIRETRDYPQDDPSPCPPGTMREPQAPLDGTPGRALDGGTRAPKESRGHWASAEHQPAHTCRQEDTHVDWRWQCPTLTTAPVPTHRTLNHETGQGTGHGIWEGLASATCWK